MSDEPEPDSVTNLQAVLWACLLVPLPLGPAVGGETTVRPEAGARPAVVVKGTHQPGSTVYFRGTEVSRVETPPASAFALTFDGQDCFRYERTTAGEDAESMLLGNGDAVYSYDRYKREARRVEAPWQPVVIALLFQLGYRAGEWEEVGGADEADGATRRVRFPGSPRGPAIVVDRASGMASAMVLQAGTQKEIVCPFSGRMVGPGVELPARIELPSHPAGQPGAVAVTSVQHPTELGPTVFELPEGVAIRLSEPLSGEACEERLASDPENPELLLRHADLLLADDEQARALEAGKKAIEQRPPAPACRVRYAQLLVRAGDLDRAEDVHRESIARFPDYGPGYFAYADFLRRSRKTAARAARIYGKGLAAAPPSPESARYHLSESGS